MRPSQVRTVGNVAAAVYGAVVAVALVAGLALDPELTPGRAALMLLSSCLAFSIAHIYALAVHQRHMAGRYLHVSELLAITRHESPQLAACVPCLLVLLAGAAGLIERATAFDYAPWAGVALLFALGIAFGRREGFGLAATLASGVFDGLLGAAVIAVKFGLSH